MQNNGNSLSTRQLNEKDMIVVTQENINNFNIEDVVLPIVGHKIKMPENEEICQIITDIMAEDKMSMD